MERLWTRSFVLMTLGSLFLFASFYQLLPTMPLYIKELGGLDAHVGLSVGVFTLAAVVVRPFAGGLLDRYGRRPFLLTGLAIFAVSMFLYGWVGGVGALLLIRVIHGIGWGFATTASGAAIADIVPASRRGEGMGWHGLSMTLAMAVGPVLGVWLLEGYAFKGMFAASAGLAVVALLAMSLPPLPFQRATERKRFELYEPTTLPVSVAVVFLAFAYGAVTTFVPLFAVTIDVNPGIYFLVYALALAVSRPLSGTLSDRLGEAAVIVPGTALTAIALAVLGSARGLGGVVAAAVLYGIGFGSAQTAFQATMLNMVPRERFGMANASFFMAFDLGIAFGTTLLGWVSQWLGYRALFGVAAFSVAICLALFVAYVRPQLRRREEVVAS